VQVNVKPQDIKAKQRNIYKLIYPRTTIMDMTIGAALWFAAEGKGTLFEDIQDGYTCQAKVLLNGLGADEQLAGYGRHRSAYKWRGWNGLQEELEKDLYRLWKRNLGRDDRIITDHAREVRFPFLDEQVIMCLNNIPLYQICNLEEPMGVGDKKLLREVRRIWRII
jgi:asparagine synthetase B (glutamine-hydrolysing)